jgi:hypothetical protein
VILGDGSAHGFEAEDVKVDGTTADGAPPGHGNTSDAGACDERAEDERARTHGLDDFILGDGVGENAAFDAGAVLGTAVTQLDLGPHAGEKLALGLDVTDLGDVFEDDLVFGEDGGSHAGEGGVFGSGDFDGAEERVAAAYYELVHSVSLRRICVEMSSWAGTGACIGGGQVGFWGTNLSESRSI